LIIDFHYIAVTLIDVCIDENKTNEIFYYFMYEQQRLFVNKDLSKSGLTKTSIKFISFYGAH
jgi:hypothetical protein